MGLTWASGRCRVALTARGVRGIPTPKSILPRVVPDGRARCGVAVPRGLSSTTGCCRWVHALLIGLTLAIAVNSSAQTSGKNLGNTVLGQDSAISDMIFFCDPLQPSSLCDPLSTPNGSGNAYDRANSDIGLITGSFVLSPAPNSARLSVAPQEAFNGVQLFLDNPTIASVNPLTPPASPTTLTITPSAVGAGTLSFVGHSNPTPLANANFDHLGTWVFPPYPVGGPVQVSYWVLADTGTLGFSSSALSSIIANVNTIWNPQANVSFQQFGPIGSATPSVSVTPLQISQDSTLASSLPVATAINVYFLPSIADSTTPNQTTLGDTISSMRCNGQPQTITLGQIFVATQDESANDVTITIAHEIGHALGYDLDLTYSGVNLEIDSELPGDSYLLMAHGDGSTITPRQRDCLSSVMF
jgi:hypothetical protein